MNDFRKYRPTADSLGRRVPVPSAGSRSLEHLINTTQPGITPEKVELPDKFDLISADESGPAKPVYFDYSVCTVVRPAPTTPEELHRELVAQRDELRCKIAVDLANISKAIDAELSGEGAPGPGAGDLMERVKEREAAINVLQSAIDQLEQTLPKPEQTLPAVTPGQGAPPSQQQPGAPAGTEPAAPPPDELVAPDVEDTPEAPLPKAEEVAGTRIAPPDGLVSSPVQHQLIAILRDAAAMTFSNAQTLEAYVMQRTEAAGIELSITPEGIEAQEIDAVDPAGVGATLREAGIKDEKLIARAIGDTNALLRAAESFVVAAQGAAQQFDPTLEDPLDLMDQWRSLVPPVFAVTAKDEASTKLEFHGQTPLGIVVTGDVTNQSSFPTQTDLPLGVTVEPFTSIFDQYEGLVGKVLISPAAPSGDSTLKK